ncbi:MAG: ABC transporter permease [Bifidobacteriaceae bacterium]|jgi:peptide/nickel transport system permease protein|nr:ABC transporter permease [Bifidobacteriaceae bacterium]
MTTLPRQRQAPSLAKVGAALRAAPWGAIVASLILALAAAAAAAPGLLTSGDPLFADPSQSNLPPSAEHLAGTDLQGRDIYTRIIYGARYSLLIGLGATVVAALAGTLLGAVAGLGPRAADQAISRIVDVICAFPGVLLALLLITFTGPGIWNLIAALGLGGLPTYARLLRSQVRLAATSGYVEQAKTYALGRWRVALRHVLPNALGPLPIVATIGFGGAIIGSSGLSFLGLGPQPPAAEWGLMVSESRNYLRNAWWTGVFPGLSITLVVIAATALGRYLQRRYERRSA